jgi:hypothetical protein
MNRYARGLVLGGVLVLGVGLLTFSGTADGRQGAKDAQKAILDLTKQVEAGKDPTSGAAEIKKKYDELEMLMKVYKPGDKGGVGFPEGKKEGVEQKLIGLAKRALPKGTLTKEEKALIRMANMNIAMAAVTKNYFDKPKAGKGKKDWDEYNASMAKASKELIEAVNAGDPAKVKAAANNITNACNECHSAFRNDP